MVTLITMNQTPEIFCRGGRKVSSHGTATYVTFTAKFHCLQIPTSAENLTLPSKSNTCKFQDGRFTAKIHYLQIQFFASSYNPFQSWIIRFRSNLVHRCKLPFRAWKFDKNRNFANSRWRTDALPYLTLPFGAGVLPPSAEASSGTMRIPVLTLRL